MTKRKDDTAELRRLSRALDVANRVAGTNHPRYQSFPHATWKSQPRQDPQMSHFSAISLAGILALSPEMKSYGLHLQEGPFGRPEPTLGSAQGHPALAKLFGLRPEVVDFIFGHHWPNDLQKAIDRLRYVVENEREAPLARLWPQWR